MDRNNREITDLRTFATTATLYQEAMQRYGINADVRELISGEVQTEAARIAVSAPANMAPTIRRQAL